MNHTTVYHRYIRAAVFVSNKCLSFWVN